MVGHNARGHSKYAKTTSSSFPNQQPPSPNSSQDPAPTQNEDPAPNQNQEERIDVDLILTNQSTIEDVAEQDVVGRVVHGQKIVQGDTDTIKVSKRGGVKKKVMQDYMQVMVKKKWRLSKTK